MPEESKALALVEQLPRYSDAEIAVRVARAAWRQLTVLQRAALAADWDYWVRSKQRPPAGAWRTWGFLTGRGFGKTVSISKFVNAEAASGRAKLIGLCAQDEQSAIDIQV